MDGDDGRDASSGKGLSEEEQRERRIQALRDLARQQLDSGDELPAPDQPGPETRETQMRETRAEREAGGMPSHGAATVAGRSSGSPVRRRLGLVALSGVLLVAIVATVIWRLTRPPTPQTADSTLPIVTINPSADGIGCPIDVAWSLDATRVAVLGYAAGCPPQAARARAATAASSTSTMYGAGACSRLFSSIAPS